MTDSPGLLSRLANAAMAGLRLLAVGLAALALAIVATVTTAVGVATKVVAEVLAQVAGLVREALPVILGLIPGLARMLCLAFALGATGYAGVQIFQAFGGDWLALGLALLLAPTPLLALYVPEPTPPRALASGTAAALAALILGAVPNSVRMFLLFVLFVWLMTRKLRENANEDSI